MKPIVIIESPYAGDVQRNVEYGKRCMLDSIRRGEAPFLSHLLYTQVLNDLEPEDRKLGMDAGWEFIRVADYSVVYGDYGISSGMQGGIDMANSLGKKILYRMIGQNHEIGNNK